MKRNLKNLLLWLVVLALMAVLFFVMDPTRMKRISQSFSQAPSATAVISEGEKTAAVSDLMKEKQDIEVKLKELQKEINDVKAAPTTVMILFSTLDEAMIREAGDMMDQRGMTGLLGVSSENLQQWIGSGVPEYIQSRLNAGWELCFILGNNSAETLQSQLEELQLPHAIAAYMVDNISTSAENLLQNGVSIALDDGVRPRASDDGLWHVPAIGSMNSNGLVIYESRRNTGTAIAYIAGNLHGDQQYIKENLEALLNLVVEDRKAGTVQNLQLQPAMVFCQKHEDKIGQYQTEWDQRETELQTQLSKVLQQIGATGQ